MEVYRIYYNPIVPTPYQDTRMGSNSLQMHFFHEMFPRSLTFKLISGRKHCASRAKSFGFCETVMFDVLGLLEAELIV